MSAAVRAFGVGAQTASSSSTAISLPLLNMRRRLTSSYARALSAFKHAHCRCSGVPAEHVAAAAPALMLAAALPYKPLLAAEQASAMTASSRGTGATRPARSRSSAPRARLASTWRPHSWKSWGRQGGAVECIMEAACSIHPIINGPRQPALLLITCHANSVRSVLAGCQLTGSRECTSTPTARAAFARSSWAAAPGTPQSEVSSPHAGRMMRTSSLTDTAWVGVGGGHCLHLLPD